MANVNYRNDRTLKLVLTALFSALIAVGAFIKFQIAVIPFTLQMCFVNLAGLILGGFYGGLSALIYLILGLIGVPIFAQGGGPMYVFKGSFGYIVGFVLAAAACGYISHIGGKVSYKSMILGTLATFVCVYACGLTHAYLISVFVAETPLASKTLIVSYFLIFLPSDILTCTASIFIAKKLIPILQKEGYQVGRRKRKSLKLESETASVSVLSDNENNNLVQDDSSVVTDNEVENVSDDSKK